MPACSFPVTVTRDGDDLVAYVPDLSASFRARSWPQISELAREAIAVELEMSKSDVYLDLTVGPAPGS